MENLINSFIVIYNGSLLRAPGSQFERYDHQQQPLEKVEFHCVMIGIKLRMPFFILNIWVATKLSTHQTDRARFIFCCASVFQYV